MMQSKLVLTELKGHRALWLRCIVSSEQDQHTRAGPTDSHQASRCLVVFQASVPTTSPLLQGTIDAAWG